MDFSLAKYKSYLDVILKNNIPICSFKEIIETSSIKNNFFLIRHDVDRKPKRALRMAILENKLGIKSTYYFRVKSNTFNKEIIIKIEELGHDIGYHYESLSDSNGNIQKALLDFQQKYKRLNDIAQIKTCSMHGKPFSQFNNLDLWKDKKNYEFAKKELGLFGDINIEIDYSDIAYINDTGRNWSTNKSNLRDIVKSDIITNFNSSKELIYYFKNHPNTKICFQIHPERWSNNIFEWIYSYFFDLSANVLKFFIRRINKLKLNAN